MKYLLRKVLENIEKRERKLIFFVPCIKEDSFNICSINEMIKKSALKVSDLREWQHRTRMETPNSIPSS